MRKIFFHYCLSLLIIYFLVAPHQISAAMNSSNYQIYADSFGITGATVTTNGSTTLSGTTGEFVPTSTLTGVYELRGGFSAAEKGILSATVNTSAVNLGTITTAAVATGNAVVTVSTDSETGYTAAVSEDGNLRSGANDINDVADGAVTAGSEEYGIRTTGTDGLLSTDTAIAGSLNIASAYGAVTDHQTTIQFRAAVSSATVNGSYAHVVTVSVTANP